MDSVKIAVIGLGYVGLPLARLFSTKYKTVGFDLNQARVDTLMAGHDGHLWKFLMSCYKMPFVTMVLYVRLNLKT